MVTLTEGRHAAEFILSEASGMRSREAIVVAEGQNLPAGAILGKYITGTAAAVAFAENAGNGIMGAVTVSAGAKPGAYSLIIIEPGADAGGFILLDPDGSYAGTGAVGSEFDFGGLAFTLADGSADFAAGDGFKITVNPTATLYAEYDPTATDGTQRVAGILFGPTDATAGNTPAAAIVRDAEVNRHILTWFEGASAGEISVGTLGLAALGIIVR